MTLRATKGLYGTRTQDDPKTCKQRKIELDNGNMSGKYWFDS